MQPLTLKYQPQVLVVEDDLDEAQLIRWQLTEKAEDAFRAEVAANLTEISSLIASGLQPDVVLLDLNLPDSTGLDTVRNVSQLLGSVPIVVHTGRDDFALTEAAIELGAQDYLIKGVDSWILRKSLRYAILRHERDEQDRLARSVFEHASEAILITDSRGYIVQVNEAFTHITGYSREEVLGRTPSLLKSGHHGDAFYQQLWEELQSAGQWRGEVWNRRKNGELYAEQLNINAVRDSRDETTQYVALFSDITQMKEEQRSLHHKANHDALTGLPNRSLFLDRLEQAFVGVRRHGGRLAVVFLDLDGFKPVNDTYGHDAGDWVLQEVSQRILGCLRAEDTLARMGGDEFVLLLQHQTDMPATLKLLQRVLSEVARPYHWKEELLQVSASLGVSLYSGETGVSGESLMQQADEAMYQAKNAGKNDFCFYDSRHAAKAAEQVAYEIEIRQALKEQQLRIYYQPVIDLQSGQPVAVEALLRWQHPEKGLLLPDDFMEGVDAPDLLLDLHEWMLDRVLEQLNTWHQHNLLLPITINISPYLLKQSSFPEHFYQQCQNRLPTPGCLSLEVKEVDALDKLAATESLQAVCEILEVHLILDDFGAGYSSLPFLKRLGVAELKTERSFIDGMLDSSSDLAVVEASLGLASAFRCRLTAKGVENSQECYLLTRLGCHQAQGHFLCKPMPLEALEDWLKSRSLLCEFLSEFGLYQREDLPLVTAAVDHRSWVHQLEEYLADRNQHLPPLKLEACRFGRWWHSRESEQGELSKQPVFQRLGEIHEQVHQTAENLLTAHQKQQQAEVEVLFDQLKRLKSEMLKNLEELLLVNKRLLLHTYRQESSKMEVNE
ncbi:EAL domain-containing protein [Marinospirillum sp.]|uniref:EAL domain-containing protein n=1 Tax=Marinospirillum sp. TaxID=2183934 RepID=UPI0028704B3D|nr:EAL domain-containing protein [Marinospirillum sp.]MDR9467241.1 EAL domain-containing protein [Marinospirillum sp.]